MFKQSLLPVVVSLLSIAGAVAADSGTVTVVSPSGDSARVKVHPNDPAAASLCTEDVFAIQSAVNAGGVVQLMPGVYNFGDGSQNWDFVGFWNSAEVRGSGAGVTVIQGGRAPFRTYRRGAVMRVEGIEFRRPKLMAVVVAAGDMTIAGNRIVDVVPFPLTTWGANAAVGIYVSDMMWLDASFTPQLPGVRTPAHAVVDGPVAMPACWLNAIFEMTNPPAGGVGRVRIEDNVIDINPDPAMDAARRSGDYGIVAADFTAEPGLVKEVVARANTIRNASGVGIYVVGFDGVTARVEGNTIEQRPYNVTAALRHAGIYAYPHLRVETGKITIAQNRILNVTGYGIYGIRLAGAVIEKNEIVKAGGTAGALHLTGIADSAVHSNRISGSGQYGLIVTVASM